MSRPHSRSIGAASATSGMWISSGRGQTSTSPTSTRTGTGALGSLWSMGSDPSPKTGREYWVDDRYATRCFSCHSKFTIVRRKHHCRDCGQVFCGDCMVVKGKDDKTCHECYDSRRRGTNGGGDTSRSHHNNTLTSATPRDFESSRGIAAHQPSSQPTSSTPRNTAHNYPAVSNASFSDMPVVMHRTTSAGQVRLVGNNNTPTHAGGASSASPRGYGGASLQNVDSLYDMSSQFPHLDNLSTSTGEYHSLRVDVPDQSKQSTVDLYTLLQDSAGGTVKLQETLRNQDPGLLHDALQFTTNTHPNQNGCKSCDDDNSFGNTVNSVVLEEEESLGHQPTSTTLPGPTTLQQHPSVPHIRPRIIEQQEYLHFDEVTLSATQYEAAVQNSARSHPVRGPPRVPVTYHDSPMQRINNTIKAGGALPPSPQPTLPKKHSSSTSPLGISPSSPQNTTRLSRAQEQLHRLETRATAAEVAHRETILKVFQTGGDLSLAQPHEETAEDSEAVTYGMYEPPPASLVNPIEVFLQSLENAVRREVHSRVAPAQIEFKEKHYVPYPFVRFRHSETSPDALLYMTSFPKVEVELPADVLMVMERRYNTRRALLSQYWDHASGAGITSRSQTLGGGTTTRTLSPRSARRKRAFLRAAMPVHPSRRSEVALSALEKRCSHHLKARVEVYMQELLVTDPGLLSEYGISPIIDGKEIVQRYRTTSRAAEVASTSYGTTPPRGDADDDIDGILRNAATAQQKHQETNGVVYSASELTDIATQWAAIICDLTWKMLSQVQVTPRSLQPHQYYQHPSCLDAPALVHSGIFQHLDVLTIEGSSIANSKILPGVAFVHTATTAFHSTTTQENPRVLLLGGHVGRAPTFTGGVGIEEYTNTYPGWLEKLYSRIETWRPSVILVEHTMHHFIQAKVAAAGIALVTLVSRSILERLERALSARLINDIAKVSIAEMRDPSLNPVGTCATFSIENFDSTTTAAVQLPVMIFSGLPRPVFCTLILRGASDKVLTAVRNILTKSIITAHHLLCLSHFCAAFKCLVGSVEGMTRLLGHQVSLQPDIHQEGAPSSSAGSNNNTSSKMSGRTMGSQQKSSQSSSSPPRLPSSSSLLSNIPSGGDVYMNDPFSPNLPLLLALKGKDEMDTYLASINNTTNNVLGKTKTNSNTANAGMKKKNSSGSNNSSESDDVDTDDNQHHGGANPRLEEAVVSQLVSDETKVKQFMLQQESLLSGGSRHSTNQHPNPAPSDKPFNPDFIKQTNSHTGAGYHKATNSQLLSRLNTATFGQSPFGEAQAHQQLSSGGGFLDVDSAADKQGNGGQGSGGSGGGSQQDTASSLPPRMVTNESLTQSYGVHIFPSARQAATLLTASEKFLLRDNIVVSTIQLERSVPVTASTVGAVAAASQYVTGFWGGGGAGGGGGAVGSMADGGRASRRTLAVDSHYNNIRPSTLAFANALDDDNGNNNAPATALGGGQYQLPAGTGIPHQTLLFDGEGDWLNSVAPGTMKDPKHEKRIFGFYNINDGDETLGEFLQDLADNPCDFTRLYLHENRKLVVRVAHEPISRAGVAQAQESFQERLDLGDCENPYSTPFDMNCYTACSTCKRAAGKDFSLAGANVSNLFATANASISRGGLFGDEATNMPSHSSSNNSTAESSSGVYAHVPLPDCEKDGYTSSMSSPHPVPYHLMRMSLGSYLEMALYANNPFTTELVDCEQQLAQKNNSNNTADDAADNNGRCGGVGGSTDGGLYDMYSKLAREGTVGYFSTLCGHPLFTSVRPCFEIWAGDRSSIATITFSVEPLGVSDMSGPSLYMGRELKNTAADALWKLQVRHDIFALLSSILESKKNSSVSSSLASALPASPLLGSPSSPLATTKAEGGSPANSNNPKLAELLPGPWYGLISELLWPAGPSLGGLYKASDAGGANCWLVDDIDSTEKSKDTNSKGRLTTAGGDGSPNPSTPLNASPGTDDLILDASFSGRLLSVALNKSRRKSVASSSSDDEDNNDEDDIESKVFDADFTKSMNALIGTIGETNIDTKFVLPHINEPSSSSSKKEGPSEHQLAASQLLSGLRSSGNPKHTKRSHQHAAASSIGLSFAMTERQRLDILEDVLLTLGGSMKEENDSFKPDVPQASSSSPLPSKTSSSKAPPPTASSKPTTIPYAQTLRGSSFPFSCTRSHNPDGMYVHQVRLMLAKYLLTLRKRLIVHQHATALRAACMAALTPLPSKSDNATDDDASISLQRKNNEVIMKSLSDSVATLIRRMPSIKHPLLNSAVFTPGLRLQHDMLPGETPFQEKNAYARREWNIRGQHHRKVVKEYYLLMEREELMRSALSLIQLMSTLGHNEFYILSVLDGTAEYMDRVAEAAVHGGNGGGGGGGGSSQNLNDATALAKQLTNNKSASFVPILGSQFSGTYFAQSAEQGRRAVMGVIGKMVDPKELRSKTTSTSSNSHSQLPLPPTTPSTHPVMNTSSLSASGAVPSGDIAGASSASMNMMDNTGLNNLSNLSRHARSMSVDIGLNAGHLVEQNTLTALASSCTPEAVTSPGMDVGGMSPTSPPEMYDSNLSDMAARSASSQAVGSSNTIGNTNNNSEHVLAPDAVSPAVFSLPDQQVVSSSSQAVKVTTPTTASPSLTPPSRPPLTSPASKSPALTALQPQQGHPSPTSTTATRPSQQHPTDSDVATGVFSAMNSLGTTSKVIFGRGSASKLFVGGLLVTPTTLLEMVSNIQTVENVAQFRKQILEPCIQELINCYFNSVQDYVYVRSHPKLLKDLTKRVVETGQPLTVMPVVPSHFPVAVIHPPPPKPSAVLPKQQMKAAPTPASPTPTTSNTPTTSQQQQKVLPKSYSTPTADEEPEEKGPVVTMDSFARRARAKVAVSSLKDGSLAYSSRYDTYVRLDEPTSLILLAIRSPALLAQANFQRAKQQEYNLQRRREREHHHHHHHTNNRGAVGDGDVVTTTTSGAPSTIGMGSATTSLATPQSASPLIPSKFPSQPADPLSSEKLPADQQCDGSSSSSGSSSPSSTSDVDDLLTARSRPVVPNVVSRTFNRTRNDVGFAEIPIVSEIEEEEDGVGGGDSSGSDNGAPNPRSTSGPGQRPPMHRREGRVDTFDPRSNNDSNSLSTTHHNQSATRDRKGSRFGASFHMNPTAAAGVLASKKSAGKGSKGNKGSKRFLDDYDVLSDEEEVAEREREVRADGAGALGEEKDARVTMKELFADGGGKRGSGGGSRRFLDPNNSLRASLAFHDEKSNRTSMTSPTSIGNSPSTSERPTFDQQPSVTVNGHLSVGGASGAQGGSGDGGNHNTNTSSQNINTSATTTGSNAAMPSSSGGLKKSPSMRRKPSSSNLALAHSPLFEDPFHIRNFDHAIDILLGKGDSAEDDTTLNNKRGGNSSSSRRKARLFEFTDVVTVADDSAIKYLSGIVAQTDKIARASVSGGGGGGSGTDAVVGGPQINPQAVGSVHSATIVDVVSQRLSSSSTGGFAPLAWAQHGLEIAANTVSNVLDFGSDKGDDGVDDPQIDTSQIASVAPHDPRSSFGSSTTAGSPRRQISTTSFAASENNNNPNNTSQVTNTSVFGSPAGPSYTKLDSTCWTDVGEDPSLVGSPVPNIMGSAAAAINPSSAANNNNNKPSTTTAAGRIPDLVDGFLPSTAPRKTVAVNTTATRRVSVEVLFPHRFAALRYLYSGGCPEDLMVSLLRCMDFTPGSGQSHKRGKSFYKTRDERFILKQVKQVELQHFLEFGPAYFSHMGSMFLEERDAANHYFGVDEHEDRYASQSDGISRPPGSIRTLLAKTLGVFSVTTYTTTTTKDDRKSTSASSGGGSSSQDPSKTPTGNNNNNNTSTSGGINGGAASTGGGGGGSGGTSGGGGASGSGGGGASAPTPSSNTAGGGTKEVKFFILMDNFLCRLSPARSFDLKGSQMNRMAAMGRKESYMDENLVNRMKSGYFFFIKEEDKSWIKNVLTRDAEMLAKQRIMDYSLVVGVDGSSLEDEVTRAEDQRLAIAGAASGGSGGAPPLGSPTVGPVGRDALMTNPESGIAQPLLYLGVIDYLHPYTFPKLMETRLKRLAGRIGGVASGADADKLIPTIIEPPQYLTRFMKYMDAYFCGVPTKTSQVKRLLATKAAAAARSAAVAKAEKKRLASESNPMTPVRISVNGQMSSSTPATHPTTPTTA